MTTQPAQSLKGKVAIVTGGGRGIGEAAALALAKEGARVALVSRTKAELDAVATKVHAAGGDAFAVVADVAEKAHATRMVNDAKKRYGRVDILVNAAGTYGPIGLTSEVGVDDWIAGVQVNLIGTFLCCRAVLPGMIAQKSGKIINLSGGGATSPLPRFSSYAAAKAGVVRLTETLAEEVKEHNVQVNAVAPGAVDTKLQDRILTVGERAGPVYQQMLKMRESGRGGVPASLAGSLIAWLASPAADKLTGKLIAAPYDGWEQWDEARIAEVMTKPWLTLRRMDQFTLKPFKDDLK